MRFDIRIRPQGSGWEVTVRAGPDVLVQSRILRSVPALPLPFPLPPEEMPTADEQALSDAFAAITSRDPGPNGVETFGRYLFRTLLGDVLWETMRARASGENIELALDITLGDSAMQRLPWEMMRDSRRFLAAEPHISITRRIESPATNFRELKSLPRVLFVVGSDLTNDVIQPGAEYLGLLRSLRLADAGLSLKTHLLMPATPERLKAALAWFQPDVVHFICHGDADITGGFLLIQSDQQSTAAVPLRPQQLIQQLRAAGLPQIVVLNACYSASDPGRFLPVGQVASPLSVELVEAGIPAVIGMGGEVADQACRLFTKLFYEALLQGEDIAQATARGRCAGVLAQGDGHVKSSVDWALPTLFLASEAGTPVLRVPPAAVAREKQIHEIASLFGTHDKYPAFFERLDMGRFHDLLLANAGLQEAASPKKRSFQMLSVVVNQSDSSDLLRTGDRFGRTWLLQEMAARMVLDGHIPVVVATDPSEDPPRTAEQVVSAVQVAAEDTAQRFEVLWNWRHVLGLQQMAAGAAAPDFFPDALKLILTGKSPADARFMRFAMRLDLLDLRAKIVQEFSLPATTRLVLLIDDVHRMGEGARYLLTELLGKDGLRVASQELRAAVTWSSKALPGQEMAVSELQKWVQNSWVEGVELRQFDKSEYPLAYRHFLLNWRENNLGDGIPKRLTLCHGLPPNLVNYVLEKLHLTIRGVPSNFVLPAVNKDLHELMEMLPLVLDRKVLRLANDEDAINSMQDSRALRQ